MPKLVYFETVANLFLNYFVKDVVCFFLGVFCCEFLPPPPLRGPSPKGPFRVVGEGLRRNKRVV